MKQLFFLSFVTLFGFYGIAQSDNAFGIKAGLNYNGNGDYIASANNVVENSDRNIGYHVGVFGKIGISKLYVRPELVYTKTKSDYQDDAFDMSKLDVPVLVGLKVVGPLNIFAGPSFQYILNTKFDDITIENVQNDFSVGLHIGTSVHFGKFGVDVRYERGFSENEATFINTNITTVEASRLDTRPDQIIVSLSLAL